MNAARHVAIIVEPDRQLGEALQAILSSWGLDAVTFATHAEAAGFAATCGSILVLIACLPDDDPDRSGAFLADVRVRHGGDFAAVVMLSHPFELARGAPDGAVRLVKPFTPGELRRAILKAGVALDGNGSCSR